MQLGRLSDADRELTRAQSLATKLEQPFDEAVGLQNRGDVAYRRGDLPQSLRLLNEAKEQYARLGAVPPEVLRDQVTVSLAAGLLPEAVAAARELVSVLDVDPAQPPSVPMGTWSQLEHSSSTATSWKHRHWHARPERPIAEPGIQWGLAMPRSWNCTQTRCWAHHLEHSYDVPATSQEVSLIGTARNGWTC